VLFVKQVTIFKYYIQKFRFHRVLLNMTRIKYSWHDDYCTSRNNRRDLSAFVKALCDFSIEYYMTVAI